MLANLNPTGSHNMPRSTAIAFVFWPLHATSAYAVEVSIRRSCVFLRSEVRLTASNRQQQIVVTAESASGKTDSI